VTTIGFVVERPTQFEAPFFRHVAGLGDDATLDVLFTGDSIGRATFDPELGQEVSWGFDLLAGYAHHRLPSSRQVRWLWRHLDPDRLDLVIINGYTRGPYLLTALVARARGVRTALRLDSVVQPGRMPGQLALRRLLYRFALRPLFDVFLATGSLAREYLAACGVPGERVALFPYAIDVAGFQSRAQAALADRGARRAALGVRSGERVVLVLAKLAGRESPWDVVEAARLSGPGITWWLAGDGPDRGRLEKLVQERGLGDRVRMLGYVPYPQLPALYAAADLFVHPAREERWGVSVAEAMACGLPVVASTGVGAAYDLIEPGQNGLIYEAGAPERLARAVETVLGLDAECVAQANRRILAAWDYDATWRHLLAVAGKVRT
jgi:glycosyltransferase involved in cell wall biosynthesis